VIGQGARPSMNTSKLVRWSAFGQPHTEYMNKSNGMSKTTGAYFAQTVVAFAVSSLGSVGGILFLPLDTWQRLFLGTSVLFLISSAFSLAKVVRDQQEAATVRVRVDEARLEKLLAEHNPYLSAAS
jgi:hypothetical protein